MDGDLVEGGVFAGEVEGFGEVLGVAVDPLALVAALGDGVELFGAEVTQGSHGDTRSRRARTGFNFDIAQGGGPMGVVRTHEKKRPCQTETVDLDSWGRKMRRGRGSPVESGDKSFDRIGL